MALFKKPKGPPWKPPARRSIHILGPKPVEEEPETDLDALAHVYSDNDTEIQEGDIGDNKNSESGSSDETEDLENKDEDDEHEVPLSPVQKNANKSLL